MELLLTPMEMLSPLNGGSLELGSYPNKVTILNPTSKQTRVQIPKDVLAGQTIHLILEATDNGTLSLTSYQRVIIMVRKRVK